MNEKAAVKQSLWRSPFVDFFGILLIEGLLYGSFALAGLLAAWIFGFEQWSNKAQVLGMAIVCLLMIVALVIIALLWARRKPEPSARAP